MGAIGAESPPLAATLVVWLIDSKLITLELVISSFDQGASKACVLNADALGRFVACFINS